MFTIVISLLMIFLSITFIWCISTWTSGCSMIPLIFWPLLGYKKVKVYDGLYQWSEDFVTYVKEDPNITNAGDLPQTAYRYNFTKIGTVRLYPDGSAEYCGSYKWKYV